MENIVVTCIISAHADNILFEGFLPGPVGLIVRSHACSSGIVTQIPFNDSKKSFAEQQHEPLGFVGHRFNQAELDRESGDFL